MRIIRAGEHIQHIPGYGISVRESGVAVAAGNGLLNSLIAYWPMNEASGTAVDAHTNGLDMAANGFVGNATGIVYATARDFTGAPFLYRVDEDLISAGDNDYTIAAWVWINATGSASFVCKYSSSTTADYALWNAVLTTNVGNSMTKSTGGYTSVGSSFGALSINTWYFLVTWHDASANTLNIQINNGTVDTVSLGASTPIDSTAPLRFGAWGGSSPNNALNGRMGPIAFWKSTAGNGGALTAAQRTALYNSGNGLAYTAFTA